MARQIFPHTQRTLIVLGTLLAAMTLGAGILLMLEPRPVAPSESARLFSTDGGPVAPEAVLFDTSRVYNWSAIVIYDSGSLEGTAATINSVHERLGLGGLGYHFVVDNGQSGPDGQIEIGFRWKRQLVGAHSSGPNGDWYNHHAIGICLVGDMDRAAPTGGQIQQLLWLVHKLQVRFKIPADRVFLQTGSGDNSPGGLFPTASFRHELLMQR